MAQTGWVCSVPQEGLCVPVAAGSGVQAPVHPSLTACQSVCMPNQACLDRRLSWYVSDSGLNECRPTLNPVTDGPATFGSYEACKTSPQANWPVLPPVGSPQGWICTNKELNLCIPTTAIGVPFTYKVYPTYQACRQAPENQPEGTKYYRQPFSGQCLPSQLSSAPFSSREQCQAFAAANDSRCQYALPPGQQMRPLDAPIQQDRPMPDHVLPALAPAVVGKHMVFPGLSGQGYGMLTVQEK